MYKAVNNFILNFTDMTQEAVYQGYQNRAARPADTQDFTVFAIADTERVGTNVTEFTTDDTITQKALREYSIDVDFCSTSTELALQRARALETIGRSFIATDFFKAYGIGFNYCDDVLYLPYTDDTQQWVERCRVTLHLTRLEAVSVPQQYAERVKIDKVINIDQTDFVKHEGSEPN